MREKSLDAIIENFELSKTENQTNARGGTVTIWLPADYKAKYEHLQKVSHKRFLKKLRELVQAAIDRTEMLAS
jgi:hypothetical protein